MNRFANLSWGFDNDKRLSEHFCSRIPTPSTCHKWTQARLELHFVYNAHRPFIVQTFLEREWDLLLLELIFFDSRIHEPFGMLASSPTRCMPYMYNIEA